MTTTKYYPYIVPYKQRELAKQKNYKWNSDYKLWFHKNPDEGTFDRYCCTVGKTKIPKWQCGYCSELIFEIIEKNEITGYILLDSDDE